MKEIKGKNIHEKCLGNGKRGGDVGWVDRNQRTDVMKGEGSMKVGKGEKEVRYGERGG